MNRNPDPSANRPNDIQGRDLPGQVDNLISLASRFHTAGRLAEEADTYHKILDIKPNWAEAHNYLGSLLYDLGKLDFAIASYQQALTRLAGPSFAEGCTITWATQRDQPASSSKAANAASNAPWR